MAGGEVSPRDPLIPGEPSATPATPAPDAAEERTDHHPCDEGDKSFFYSLHCGNPKRKCPHCGQMLCPYHFEPNSEGVVGGHSDCKAESRSSARRTVVSSQAESAEDDDAPRASPSTLQGDRGSKWLKKLTCWFEVFMAVFAVVGIGGIGFYIYRKISGGILSREHHGHGHSSRVDMDLNDLEWTWLSVVLVVLLILSCCAFVGLESVIYVGATWQAINKGVMPVFYPSFIRAGSDAVAKAMGRFLASEAVLGFIVTVVGIILSALFSTAEDGTPIWVLLFALPLVVRTKIIEWNLLPFYGGRFVFQDVMSFALSALEVYDRFSDGLTIPVMYKCDELIHEKWIQTFMSSANPFVRHSAPIANVLHLWRCSAFFLFCSMASQQVLGMEPKGLKALPTFDEVEMEEPGYGPPAPQAALAADIAGMGSLARRFTARAEQDGRKGMISAALGVTKSFLENMPQGLSSAALLGLQGKPLTNKPVVAFSAVISTASLGKQGLAMLTGSLSLSRTTYREDVTSGIAVFICLFPAGVAVLTCTIYLATKLTMVQLCPDHEWGLTSGCIHEHVG